MSATRVSGWVEERDSDQFVSFVMWVSAAKRPKILALDLVPIPRPAAFPIPRLTEGEAIAGVEALLRKQAAADRFSGAALVAKEGKVLFADAYGQADRERGIPNTIETRFRIGSMNKMFTAVATLQLVEAGKLALDDPVGKHLRGYPNSEVATKVTVRHLLTHTGGTGDIFGPEYDRNRLQLREHADYVKLYGSRAPNFPPGSRFEYSNYGFVLLGAIIEAVSGESYYDYVREHVFGPAGMTSTDSLPESEEVPNRSIGYMGPGPGAQSWQPNTDWLPWRGTAAGGGYSTVGDVARFADALTSHKLLSPDSTELLTTGKVTVGPGASYAFGFVDFRDKDGNGSVGHSGGAPGHERGSEDLPEVRVRGRGAGELRSAGGTADLRLSRPATSDLVGIRPRQGAEASPSASATASSSDSRRPSSSASSSRGTSTGSRAQPCTHRPTGARAASTSMAPARVAASRASPPAAALSMSSLSS